MSRGFSRVILVGNLGRDPEMRYSQSGIPITNFTMAVGRRRRQQDGSYADETSWYRVSLFRQQAESAAEWLRKGSRVLVEGQIRVRNYVGQDGVERTSVDVDADSFMNLTPRGEDMGGMGSDVRPAVDADAGGAGQYTPRTGGAARPAPAKADAFDDDDLDDVPF